MSTVLPISARVDAARRKIRSKGRKIAGLRFIDHGSNPETELFAPGGRGTKIVLENLDRQPQEAFEVFTNWNDEVVVRQLRWTPFFHLV